MRMLPVTLIAELARIADELERHGLDHDGAHYGDALEALEFSNGANSAIAGLIARLKTVKGCLAARGAPTPPPGRHDGSGHRGPGRDGATHVSPRWPQRRGYVRHRS